MSRFHILTLILLIAFLNIAPSFSADPSEISPSPVPEPGSDAPAPLSNSSSPSPSPSQNSPPAPPPADLAPNSSPSAAPAPGTNGTNSQAPSPADGSGISHEDAGDMNADDSAGGMSKGKKVGIAIGVIAGVCIVGVGALVYKKRQQNIRRGQFGYAARGDFL